MPPHIFPVGGGSAETGGVGTVAEGAALATGAAVELVTLDGAGTTVLGVG